jgi:hypothetical protein
LHTYRLVAASGACEYEPAEYRYYCLLHIAVPIINE